MLRVGRKLVEFGPIRQSEFSYSLCTKVWDPCLLNVA